jgi:hypothetical protein
MSAVACSLALGACSLATPYQRHDGSLMSFGGYYDKQVAEDEFHVAFYINQFTDQETGKEYWRRRSREVCREKGFSDFTVIGDIPPPYHVPPNFFVWKAAIRCVK